MKGGHDHRKAGGPGKIGNGTKLGNDLANKERSFIPHRIERTEFIKPLHKEGEFRFSNCPGGQKPHKLKIFAVHFDSVLSQKRESAFFP